MRDSHDRVMIQYQRKAQNVTMFDWQPEWVKMSDHNMAPLCICCRWHEWIKCRKHDFKGYNKNHVAVSLYIYLMGTLWKHRIGKHYLFLWWYPNRPKHTHGPHARHFVHPRDLNNSDLIWTESLNGLKSICASGVIHWTCRVYFTLLGVNSSGVSGLSAAGHKPCNVIVLK